MNALVETRALALTDDELIQTLRDSLYPGASDRSIKMVIGWCKASGKDPMKKPAHIVPMNVKKPGTRDQYEWRDVVMPGIVDYRTDAARTGLHAGNDEAVFGPEIVGKWGDLEVRYPEWCEFKVYRIVDGRRCAFSSGRVRWTETYATAGKDSAAPNAMWRKRPYGQLEKCAEALALRRGFPEVGAQPTADEMAGRVIDGGDAELVTEVPPPPPPAPEVWPAEAFAAQLTRWTKAVQAGFKSIDDILALARSKGALTAEQEAAIRAIAPATSANTSANRQTGGGQSASAAEHADFVAGMDAAEKKADPMDAPWTLPGAAA